MHLPDGFLDAKTAAASLVVAGASVGVALRQVQRVLKPRQIPMLGMAAAFVFAAQMLNFPVLSGTSGHLLGGVLVAILLGPAPAVVVMTCVLIVQCLMFADGGLLALGANVFNMAIVGTLGGYFIYRLMSKVPGLESQRATVCAAAFAGWFGTVIASISCAGQLALSGTVAWGLAFPAMTDVHMLIGLGEGAATGLIIWAVQRTRPEILTDAREAATPGSLLPFGLLVSVGLALFVSPFACKWPDGLEAVAGRLGFAAKTAAPVLTSPLTDYHLPWIKSAAAATALAGLLGTAVAFFASLLFARLLVPCNARSKS